MKPCEDRQISMPVLNKEKKALPWAALFFFPLTG
jgi:hypothetical protein